MGKNRNIPVEKEINMLASFICLILVFIYIFPMNFVILPFSTRVLLALLGLWEVFVNRKKINLFSGKVSYSLFLFFVATIGVTIISFISILLNNTNDKEYISYPFVALTWGLAAYGLVYSVHKIKGKMSFDIMARLVILACLLQVSFAILFFIFPDIKMLFYSYLKMGEAGLSDALERSGEYRFHGFGANFFAVGVVIAMTLLLISYQLSKPKYSSFAHIVELFLLLTIGCIMARTSLVGFVLGIIYLIYKMNILSFRLNIFTSKLLAKMFIVFVFIGIIGTYIYNQSDELQIYIKYGFELFFNYFERGELSSNSVDTLIENGYMFPSSLTGWIIGDGYFSDPTASEGELSYYMHTDIGYCRLIFYFGVVGLILYLLVHAFLTYYCIYLDKKNRFFYILLFLLFLIILNKGVTNFIHYYLLFAIVNSFSKTSIYGKR